MLTTRLSSGRAIQKIEPPGYDSGRSGRYLGPHYNTALAAAATVALSDCSSLAATIGLPIKVHTRQRQLENQPVCRTGTR